MEKMFEGTKDSAQLRTYEMALNSAAVEFARPLELIEWNCCFLQEHFKIHRRDYSEQAVKDALQDIHAAAVNMNRMVDHFTQLCACMCGTVPMQEAYLDLASMLRSLCADHEAIYRAIGVRLALEYDSGDLWHIVADPVMMERVLLHLLSNGLRACRPGENVLFRLGRRRGEIVLTVQDDGCGMTEEQAQDAFKPEKLYLLQNRQSERDNGLGLLLCGEYCRMMGWKIEISPQKKGIIVTVVIPERRELLPQICLHSPGERQQEVSRVALLQELHSIPGLEGLRLEGE